MLDAGSAIDEIMHLALQHRFKVLLHLPPGDLDDNTHIRVTLRLDILEARSNDLHFSVYNLI